MVLKADLVTVPHLMFNRVLEREYRARNVAYIPHGVFHEPRDNSYLESKRFLVFGKMGGYKNLGLALEAFKEVQQKDAGAELVIAGPPNPLDGGYFRTVMKQYSDLPNLKFNGYIQEQDIGPLFTSSLAVIMPYTITTWSSGVFTIASSYGKPVIASDLPDFRELRDENAGVILFPSGDKDALAQAMIELLHNQQLRMKMRKANLEWAKRNSFRDVVAQFVQSYDLLARESAAR
jgi:glycosyltransferase involved in cell wall biosynthesis